MSLAEPKVRHDLASALNVYNKKINDIRNIVHLDSLRDSIQRFLLSRDRENLERNLSLIRREFNLDILSLTDERGRVVFRTINPRVYGDDLSSEPVIARALRGKIAYGTSIIKREILMREGEDLAQRAYLKFIPTPKVTPALKIMKKMA